MSPQEAARDSGSSCLWEGGGTQAEVMREQHGGKWCWELGLSLQSQFFGHPLPRASLPCLRESRCRHHSWNSLITLRSLPLRDPPKASVNKQIWSWPLSPYDGNRFREDRAQRRPHSASTLPEQALPVPPACPFLDTILRSAPSPQPGGGGEAFSASLDIDTSLQSRGHALHPSLFWNEGTPREGGGPGFGEGTGGVGPAAHQVPRFLLAPAR